MARPAEEPRVAGRLPPAGVAAAIAIVVVTTATARLIGSQRLADADVVLLYLVGITIVAVRYGRTTAIVAAALSVAGFDLFFIPPFYTFTVENSRHVITFVMMFIVGVFVSSVAARLKQQELDALARERRTQSLLALTKATAAAETPSAVAESLAEHAKTVFQREATVSLGDTALAQPGKIAIPLSTQVAIEGVLLIDAAELDAETRELADAFARQSAAALERLRLAEEAKAAAVRRRSEEMRSALLSAVSHDLRTPLGGITGAATTLLQEGAQLSESDRRALLEAIADQGFRLEKLVAGLLDMTRVEGGALVLRREWVPVDEIIGSALARTRGALGARPVVTEIGDDLRLLHVDAVLLEQVLVNLLDNAAKHTPPDASVLVRASESERGSEIVVEDTGTGLPDGLDIFEKFVRGPGATRGGLGLGLAICKSIIDAHDGTLSAQPRPGGGARFVVTLPPSPAPPEVSA